MYSRVARTASLLLAILLSAIIFIIPQAWVSHDGTINHLFLMSMLFGIMLGFINGIGFQLATGLFRYLFHPVLAWSLMCSGLIILGLSLNWSF